jgi:hypothetical protein
LSFPLLCLQNYFSFRFLTGPNKFPVKINGDDIVFRAPMSVYNRWADGVSKTGLTLSRGKTMVATDRFSLNSTFFWPTPDRVKLVPVIRSTVFFKDVEGCSSIAGRFHTLHSFPPLRRRFLQTALLRRLRKWIYCSQRSLRRGFCLRIPDGPLKAAGLWERECFYLSAPKEPPLPPDPLEWRQNAIPPGWERVKIFRKPIVRTEFLCDMVDCAWSTQPVEQSRKGTDEYWSFAREGTFSCSSWLRDRRNLRRRSRLLGMSRTSAKVYLSESLPKGPKRKFYYEWRPRPPNTEPPD